MQIFSSLSSIPQSCQGSCLIIGKFDGVHLGHQAVLNLAKKEALLKNAPLAVLTFEPHPDHLFSPQKRTPRLTCARSKAEALEQLDVNYLFCPPFDEAFSQITAGEFITDILRDKLHIKHLCIGDDFRFGAGRQGSLEDLKKAEEKGFFSLSILPEVLTLDSHKKRVSSSLIRTLIQDGKVFEAQQLLSRPYTIDSKVLNGKKLGRTLGFPTANLDLGFFTRPRKGVYAVRVCISEDKNEWINGVANFGTRPTVDGKKELLEVHLFDFSGDLYGSLLKVAFIDFIRPEQTFANLNELKHQITQDCDKAKELLNL